MHLAWLMWLAAIMPPHLSNQTCLATTVYLEARGQPVLGQKAVAEVAMRRRASGLWGDNVCSVVNAPKQFAPTLVPPGTSLNNLVAWKRAWNIAGEALANWSLPKSERTYIVPGANSFYATSIAPPRWAQDEAPLAVIGSHRFYAVN